MNPAHDSMDALIAWCETELTALRTLRDWMEGGTFCARKRDKTSDPWIDITSIRLVGTKRKIAELEAMLMAIRPRKVSTQFA